MKCKHSQERNVIIVTVCSTMRLGSTGQPFPSSAMLVFILCFRGFFSEIYGAWPRGEASEAPTMHGIFMWEKEIRPPKERERESTIPEMTIYGVEGERVVCSGVNLLHPAITTNATPVNASSTSPIMIISYSFL